MFDHQPLKIGSFSIKTEVLGFYRSNTLKADQAMLFSTSGFVACRLCVA